MEHFAFKELALTPVVEMHELKVNDNVTLEVRNYLPMDQKIELIQFIVDNSVDEKTGTFSPVRVEIWTTLAICHWYAGIQFDEEDLTNVTVVYDLLDSTKLIDRVIGLIDSAEYEFITSLVENTIRDIGRYNTSAAGIIHAMSENAAGLDGQITTLLDKVKNGEGLEQLAIIKDVVGTV